MKFLCRNCKAKYQIADEKVAGRTLRMTCQQCGEPIVVRGPAKQTGQTQAGHAQAGHAQAGHAQTGRHSAAQAPAAAFVPQAAGKAAAAGLAADLSRHAPIIAPAEPQPQEEWHVAINDAPVGPLRRDEVARRIAQGVINRESLAWREGMDDWMQIKHIAELTALFSPVSVVPPTSIGQFAPAAQFAPPPPAAAVSLPHVTAPATRSDMAPIGGRKVVPVEETYEPPLETAEPTSDPPEEVAVATMTVEAPVQVPVPAPAPAPVIAAGPAATRPAPGWAQMFALVSGGAFILAAGALLGVRVLAPSNTANNAASATPAPASAPQVAAPTPPPPAAAPAEQKAEDNSGGSVIELDMQAIDGRSGAGKKSGTAASGSATNEDKKKPGTGGGALSAEQRAMLERMGGGLDQGPSNLRAPSEAAKAGGAQGAGQLTAEQLSAVVLNGRKNLQRCYETALRGAASQDTVRLDVEITVSANGNVTSVHAAGKGLPGMDDCITRTVKMWRFPRSAETTSTRFPVVFQPGT